MSTIKRTQFAQAAYDYAAHFDEVFGGTEIGGGCIRRPHLVLPEGMSTGGGKLARQHLTLRPETPGFATLTVGAVDVGKGAASLRTFGCLQQAHNARYGDRPFDLDGEGYNAFYTRALDYFSRQGMWVDVESETSVLTRVSSPKKSNTALVVIVSALVVIILAAIGVSAYVLYSQLMS